MKTSSVLGRAALLVSLTASAALSTGCAKDRVAGMSKSESAPAAVAAGPSDVVSDSKAALDDAAGGSRAGKDGTPNAAAREVTRALEITLSLTLAVDGTEKQEQLVGELQRFASASGGFVQHGEINGTTATLVLRIPPRELGSFEARTASMSKTTHRTMMSKDVTEAVMDLEARLRTSHAEEDRLLKILVDRTASLSEVLMVEQNLAQVRTRIEQLEASHRAQKSRIDLATVNVSINAILPPPVAARELTFLDRAGEAAKDGGRGAKTLIQETALFALRTGPVLVLVGGALAVFAIVVRRIKRGRRAFQAAST